MRTGKTGGDDGVRKKESGDMRIVRGRDRGFLSEQVREAINPQPLLFRLALYITPLSSGELIMEDSAYLCIRWATEADELYEQEEGSKRSRMGDCIFILPKCAYSNGWPRGGGKVKGVGGAESMKC